MDPADIHRKRVQHFDVPSHAHLLTFSCYQRRPLLKDDRFCALLSQCIDQGSRRLGFSLIAFVYMPEHVHLLVLPRGDPCLIERILFTIKKPFSDQAKRFLVAEQNPLLASLQMQEKSGRTAFRFWQQGPGFDRNIASSEACIVAAEYLHNNPVRRGLRKTPAEWRWSSWKYYNVPDAYGADSELPRIDGFPG